jgi:hypothetical protein
VLSVRWDRGGATGAREVGVRSSKEGAEPVSVPRTVDEPAMRASADQVSAAAAQAENWPGFLPNYRWVKLLGALW